MTWTIGPEPRVAVAPDVRLALFDLDHTLLPFDSGMAWLQWLAGTGRASAQHADDYLQVCKGLQACTPSPEAGASNEAWDRALAAHRPGLQRLHRLCLLAATPGGGSGQGWRDAEVQSHLAAFSQHVAQRVPARSRAWVHAQHAEGAVCMLVSATVTPLVQACARALGVAHALGSPVPSEGGEGVQDAQHSGRSLTGLPCWGLEKPRRVEAAFMADWDAAQRRAAWQRAMAYSDSFSDLPLLSTAGRAVAVNPDARLRTHALAQGWPIEMHSA